MAEWTPRRRQCHFEKKKKKSHFNKNKEKKVILEKKKKKKPYLTRRSWNHESQLTRRRSGIMRHN